MTEDWQGKYSNICIPKHSMMQKCARVTSKIYWIPSIPFSSVVQNTGICHPEEYKSVTSLSATILFPSYPLYTISPVVKVTF